MNKLGYLKSCVYAIYEGTYQMRPESDVIGDTTVGNFAVVKFLPSG